MSDPLDDNEFAYFLPRGIEDDADDFSYDDNVDIDGVLGGGSSSGNGASPNNTDDTDSLHSSLASHPSFAAYNNNGSHHTHHRGSATTTTTSQLNPNSTSWQPSHTPSTAQQAALLSVLAQRDAHNARHQLQIQPHITYSNTPTNAVNTSSETLLSSFYNSQQQQQQQQQHQQQPSSPSYYTPSPSPVHLTNTNVFPTSSSIASTTSGDTPAGLNAQQMQFFQQLQLYQQELLRQQQQQSSTSSHYTKAPINAIYEERSNSLISDERPDMAALPPAFTPAAAAAAAPAAAAVTTTSDRSRRPPLPHHSHTNVTIMNRPPQVDDDAAPIIQPRQSAVVQVQQHVVKSTVPVVPTPTSSNWVPGHTMTFDQPATTVTASSVSHQASVQQKSVPVKSVVASTKTEKWPKVKTVIATVTAPPATAAVAVSTTPVATVVETSASEKKLSVTPTRVKTVTTTVKRTVPIATIRHIESDEPVPLTAAEMASLNAHHRKGAVGIVPTTSSDVPTPASSPAPTTITSTIPTVRRQRSDAKFMNQAKPIPNENVFDFLADADPDEMPLITEKGKKKKKLSNADREAAANAATQDETSTETSVNDDPSKEDSSSIEFDDAKVEPDTETEEPDEEDEEEPELVESDSATSSPILADGVSDADADDDDTRSSPSASPDRTISPQLSQSNLSNKTSQHQRRVSFQQTPSPATSGGKKSAIVTKGGKEVAASAIDGEVTVAPTAPTVIESGSGAKKKEDKKKKGKGKSTSSVPIPTLMPTPPVATVTSTPKLDDEDDDDDDDDDAALASPTQRFEYSDSSKSTGGLQQQLLNGLKMYASDFYAQHLASRSRSVSQRMLSLASYLLGIIVGLAWTVFCLFWRVHRQVALIVIDDHQTTFYCAFIYLFPYLVHHMTFWAPAWAASCLWYAFLIQVFCTRGSPILVGLFRVLLPLLFITEGVSHHTFLLGLNGSERLVLALIFSSFKTQEYYRPMFLFTLASQILISLIYGSSSLGWHWPFFVTSLLVIHQHDADVTLALLPGTTSSSSTSSSSSSSFTSSLSHLNHPPESSSFHSLRSEKAFTASGVDLPTGLTESIAGVSVPPPINNSTSSSSSSSVGWLGSMFGTGGVSSALNRRTRAKASVQKSRRTGRF